MNSAAIEVGEYYAYAYYKFRGIYPVDALKVEVLRVYKKKEYSFDQRRKTYVDIKFADGRVVKHVPARKHIVDRWEDYEGERDHHIAERVEHRKEQQKEEMLRQLIEREVINKGLPATATVQLIGREPNRILQIRMDMLATQVWLGITTDMVREAIDNVIGEDAA